MSTSLFRRLQPYWPIFLFSVFYLQRLFLGQTSPVTIACFAIFILYGVYSMIIKQSVTLDSTLNRFWLVFALMLIITIIVSPYYVYGVRYEAIGRVNTLNQGKYSIAFALTYFSGYLIGKKNKVLQNDFFYLAILIFITSVVHYFLAVFFEEEATGEENRGFTNNASYFIATSLPFFPFIFKRSKAVALVLFTIATSLIVLGSKRGALVCTFVAFAFSIYYYVKRNPRHVSLNTKIIIGFVILLFVGFIINRYYSNEYLMRRMDKMEESGIGNREIAYRVLFNHWLNDDNPLTFLFGNGTSQAVTIWGNYAHMDWLELLIDNGLFGVIIYASIYFRSFKYVYDNEFPFHVKWCLYLCLIIWGLKSCFSMGYNNFSTILMVYFIGMGIGNNMRDPEDEALNDPDDEYDEFADDEYELEEFED